MSYDLQGRLETATIETFQTDGTTVDRRETTSYDYDHTGIRVSARNTVEMWTTDWLTQVTQFGQVRDYTTAYLVDHDNFTGYEQVLLEETRPTSGGYAVRRVTYTLGHDVIGQWSEGIIPPPGQGEYSFGMNVPTGSHLLVADAHGSTRVLAPADIPGNGQVVLQQYSYDAYGLPLGFNPAESATTLLYSGEQYDQRDDLYYFRGRDYRAGTGTFTTLDPYFGNLYDPQTLHKTLYVNADPINGIDPTGKMGLTSLMVGLGIATNIRSLKNESDMLTFDIASTMFIGVQAGMSVEATFWMFAEGQLSGFLIGFALGKAVTKLSDIWENGVTILSPRRGASSVGSRPFAVLHNTDFRFPRSKNAIAPKSGLGVLPIDEARIGVFNSVQQPRVREWAGWTRSTDGVKDVRLRQEQHNVLGMHISKNEPDLQLTLQGGRTYKLPGGAEIEIPFGQDRRVYIEFDPYKGSRGNAHLKNLLGDDAQSLVVLDTFDKNGLVSSVTFNNM
jgi:RHS repeat-associated protein